MYATVALTVGQPQQLITLPQTAITANPYGDTVFIVDKKGEGGDKKAEDALAARQVFVKSGATRGDQIAVTEGIKEGDTVVVAGQMKLRNGTPVIINNSTMPTADASPVITDQ
jgi:membrane fusion protein (multidrug efflux system)